MANLFITWDIDPAIFSIGPLELRYYSLSWLLAFVFSALIMGRMMKREWGNDKLLDSLTIYCIVGSILGARLGHCLFYEPEYYLTHPVEILKVWKGGLASHGGAIGTIIAAWLFGRKHKIPFLWTVDHIAVVTPMLGGLIRIGNLFNSEIFGTPTDLPWGFKFVRSSEWLHEYAPQAVHPTQLYEALAYFLIFAIVLILYYNTHIAVKKPGAMIGLSMALIFIARFFIEMIKVEQVDFEKGMVLNMGQILSIPFIVVGITMFILGMKGVFKSSIVTKPPQTGKNKEAGRKKK